VNGIRAAALAVIVGTSLTSVVASSGAGEAAKPRPSKPAITKVDPKFGPTTGGTVVKIKGKHLTGTTKVLFGKAKGTKVKVKNDHKLTVVAPAHAQGVVDVRVKTKGGKSAKASGARYTYVLEKPAVTGVTPASGPSTGGNQVTVSGTGFTAVTAVTFGGTPGGGVTVASPTQLTVTAPAHAAGLVHLNVTNAAGTSPTKVADLYRFVLVTRSMTAPLPAGAAADPDVTLGTVSCPSTTFCAAVGDYQGGGAARRPLVEQRTGSTWAAIDPDVPAGAASNPDAHLRDLSCPSPSFCVAVGSYKRSVDGFYVPLVVTWNGATWSSQTVALPGTSTGLVHDPIYAVDCASATSCVAVGADSDGVGAQELVLELASGTWTSSVVAPPAGSTGGLYDVSCSAAYCAAVGAGQTASGQVPLVATRNGGPWTSATLAQPVAGDTASSDAVLEAVACTAATVCTAVGHYVTTDAKRLGMIQQQSAGGWTALAASAPPGAQTNPGILLNSVSCVTGYQCTTVGQYQDGGGVYRPLLVGLAAGSVTPVAGPLPAGSVGDSPVYDVTCLVVSVCAAVGRHTPSTGASPVGLLETLAPSGWSAASAPTLTGWAGGNLESVTADGTVAVAVGSYSTGGTTQGLIVVDVPLA